MGGSPSARMRLDAFMEQANATYYAAHDPFADFTTSPEIAQVFGELLGAWAAVVWQMMGRPRQVALVEAGPGRGTLMQDALRCIGQVAPGFAAVLKVHFVEKSARLRAAQSLRVPKATWHDRLDTVPTVPFILVANEFLDALPIRQFVRRKDGWTERFVQDGVFVEMPSEHGPGREVPVGDVAEISDDSRAWIADVARRIVTYGGVALVLDYGPACTSCGDSLQALRGGKPADPLVDPGSADLTAHVDFAAIARAAQDAGAAVWGPLTQGEFLQRLGVWERTAALAAANPARAAELRGAAMRLVAPMRMGHLFKAMCVSQPGFGQLPGFEP